MGSKSIELKMLENVGVRLPLVLVLIILCDGASCIVLSYCRGVEVEVVEEMGNRAVEVD